MYSQEQEQQLEEIRKPNLRSKLLDDSSILREKIEKEAILAKRKAKEKPMFVKKEDKKEQTLKINNNKTEKSQFKQEKKDYNFVISYYNPELKEEEVFPEQVTLHMDDVTNSVEEASAQKTTEPMFSYITAPFSQPHNPDQLNQLIALKPAENLVQKEFEKELEKLNKLIEEQNKIAVKPLEVDPLTSKLSTQLIITEVEKRKQEIEKKIEEHIKAIEKAIELIRKNKKEEALEVLPALSRERFKAALKKKLPDSKIIEMLLYDKLFLSKAKSKLKNLSLKGLKLLSDLLSKIKEGSSN